MSKLYFESVVLATIDYCKKHDLSIGQINLVEQAQVGNKTLIAAIERLEKKGRLRVIRAERGLPHDYEVLDPPTELDRTTRNLHLLYRNKLGNGAHESV